MQIDEVTKEIENIEESGNGQVIETGKSKVALVRCSSYDRQEVEAAVAVAIDLLGGPDIIGLSKDAKLVLKPNLLAKATPEKAVTTHPEVFRAVAKYLQDAGYRNLSYGDSPGNPMISVAKTAEGCGIRAMADELGIPAGDFEHGTEVEFPEGRTSKKFMLCNEIAEALKSGGGVINICKMKTHQLERITGAVKNTFGCVFGVNKTAAHAMYTSAEVFARMLADLNRLVSPKLHIMDGVMAMEGNGPASGDPVTMYSILASTDPVALDSVFCHLIDLDADLVPTNVSAADAGIGVSREEDIDIITGGEPMIPDGRIMDADEVFVKFGYRNFNVQRSREYRGMFNVLKPLERILEKKPLVIADKCISCGICQETCPLDPKAIHVEKGSPAVYDYSRCIKCYCCQEMCPEKAIKVKKSLLARIADRKWRM